ncbi:hypothetical protein [Spirosoma arcticum]
MQQIKAGATTADAVQFMTGVGKLLVTHDKIERLETLPVITPAQNTHMSQVLDYIEKNTVHLGEEAQQQGKAVVEDACIALNDSEKGVRKRYPKGRAER